MRRPLTSLLARRPCIPEEPIRSELFSVERLEQHAESLAAAQAVTRRPGRGRLLANRLRDNDRVLLAAYRAIGAAIREGCDITPAAECLVDIPHRRGAAGERPPAGSAATMSATGAFSRPMRSGTG